MHLDAAANRHDNMVPCFLRHFKSGKQPQVGHTSRLWLRGQFADRGLTSQMASACQAGLGLASDALPAAPHPAAGGAFHILVGVPADEGQIRSIPSAHEHTCTVQGGGSAYAHLHVRSELRVSSEGPWGSHATPCT